MTETRYGPCQYCGGTLQHKGNCQNAPANPLGFAGAVIVSEADRIEELEREVELLKRWKEIHHD